MKKSAPFTKGQAIITAIIIVVTLSLVLYAEFSPNSTRITKKIEKSSFTLKLPKPFYEDSEGDYIYDGDDYMYVSFAYIDNESLLSTECLALLCESSYYNLGDVVSRQEININGTNAWQMEYNTTALGADEIQNYYAGVFTVLPLENEFLIVDAYEYLAEESSEYIQISDKKIKLFKDITSTIQITDAGYDNTLDEALWLNANKLRLKLSSNWKLDGNADYGFSDYGYFVSYRFLEYKMWLNIYEYNDENIIDLHDIMETKTKDSTYTSMGEGFIAGERALLYSYNAYSENNAAPYSYGAAAISEHYVIDMHFDLYTDEYTLPYDTARKMLNDVLKIENK